jgi:hypothetical protein
MDCDDQVWIVKRDNHPHANTLDLPGERGLPFLSNRNAAVLCVKRIAPYGLSA